MRTKYNSYRNQVYERRIEMAISLRRQLPSFHNVRHGRMAEEHIFTRHCAPEAMETRWTGVAHERVPGMRTLRVQVFIPVHSTLYGSTRHLPRSTSSNVQSSRVALVQSPAHGCAIAARQRCDLAPDGVELEKKLVKRKDVVDLECRPPWQSPTSTTQIALEQDYINEKMLLTASNSVEASLFAASLHSEHISISKSCLRIH